MIQLDKMITSNVRNKSSKLVQHILDLSAVMYRPEPKSDLHPHSCWITYCSNLFKHDQPVVSVVFDSIQTRGKWRKQAA